MLKKQPEGTQTRSAQPTGVRFLGAPPRGTPGNSTRAISGPLVILAAASVAITVLLPIVVVLVRGASVGPSGAAEALWRPRVGELLLNSLGLVGCTVVGAVLIGVGAAWLVERTTLPGTKVWRALLVAPLAIPAFVVAYGWISVIPSMQGLWAASLVTSLAYFPFVFLPVSAVMRGLDQSFEDSARALGLSSWGVFVRILLPQCRAAISGGALIVALHALAEYGVLEMMRFATFTTAILEQFAVGFATTSGALLACVLLVLCVVLLGLERVARGNVSVARASKGAARSASRVHIGWGAAIGAAALLAVSFGAVGIPLISVIRWVSQNPNPIDSQLLIALLATVQLGFFAALLATVAALPVVWLAVRRRGSGLGIFERCTYVASALPGVVVALAFVTIAARYVPAIYQTALLLVIAYMVLFLPRAVVAVRAGLEHAPVALTDAAHTLGVGGFAMFRRVVLPLVAKPIAAGAALVFLATSTELTATLLLAPTGVTTLATGFWGPSDQLDYVSAAPYALALIVLSIPMTILLLRETSRKAP